MSQAKVDRYKDQKANRKKIMAKEKAKRVAAKICAGVVAVAIVGWAGYSTYDYIESKKPAKTYEINTAELDDYLGGLSTEE